MNGRFLSASLFPLGFLVVSVIIEIAFGNISENALRYAYLDHIAIIAAQLINILTPNDPVLVLGNALYGKAHLVIASTCSGSGFLSLLAAAIIVFSTSVKNKVIGLLMGIVIVIVFNMGRIIGLYLTMAYHPDWFLWVHEYVTPTLMTILFCLFFAVWAFWASDKGYG